MRWGTGLILGVAMVGALACSGDQEILDPCIDRSCARLQIDGAAVFSRACSECHTLEDPMLASFSVPDEAWALLREMTEHGLCLTDGEKAAIVNYLCSSRFQNSH